jgi:ABC-type methionine transport system ATPase subunit
MVTKVFLTFPRHLISEPILYELVQRFEVKTNIRGASVTDQIALVALELDGEGPEVDKAIAHMTEQGIQVERLQG